MQILVGPRVDRSPCVATILGDQGNRGVPIDVPPADNDLRCVDCDCHEGRFYWPVLDCPISTVIRRMQDDFVTNRIDVRPVECNGIQVGTGRRPQ